MHIYKKNQITNELVNEIVSLYKDNYTVKEIAKAEDMFHNEVISILSMSDIPLEDYKDQIPSLDIDNKKVVFASDHHMGAWLEREEYPKFLNAFAKNRKIRHVFILGDLFHGFMHKVTYEIQTPEELLYHVVENYPYDESIQVHILFGNHEYEIFRQYPKLLEILSLRDDFDILGFREAIIKWRGELACLHHPIDKSDVPFPYIPNKIIQIEGHHHNFQVKNDIVYLPPMSNIFTKSAGEVYPGFLLGHIKQSELMLSLVEFSYGKTYDRGKVLEKKIEKPVD